MALPSRTPSAVLLLCTLLLAAALAGCGRGDALPDPSSDTYRQLVSAFYTGVAAMEVGEDQRADAQLQQAATLVPGEPAAWANLALLAMRRSELDVAAERLDRARTLAPDDSRILLLSGLLAGLQEQPEEARTFLRRALAADAANAPARFALVRALTQQDGPDAAAEAPRQLDTLLTMQPDNLALLTERARLAAQQEDRAALQQSTDRLAALSTAWPEEARTQLGTIQQALRDGDAAQATSPLAFLRNVLLSLPLYRRDLAAVEAPAELVAEPFARFLRLPAPRPTPAPPDDSLTFTPGPLLPDTSTWAWTGVFSLTGEGVPSAFVADGQTLQWVGGPALPFPGGPAAQPPTPAGIAALDYNYDFLMDLALAGAGGLRLYRQDSTTATFTDVTAQMALPAGVVRAAYTGLWAADLDLEGDVDLVLGRADGPTQVLRNNGDGSFTALPTFAAVRDLRAFAWADLDADGDPDAALLDGAGTLQVLVNERQNTFRPRPLPEALGTVQALTATDADGDSVIDLVLLQADGTLRRLSDDLGGTAWSLHDLARWDGPAAGRAPGTGRLFAADLDNNGGFDLIASAPGSTQVWLRDAAGAYQPLPQALGAHVFAVTAFNQPDRLDLVGVASGGQPVVLANRGTKAYQWKQVRPRAATAVGDQRINSFGIGGEVELRAGLLFQKQPITEPSVHFGLGDNLEADVARIIWPNGSVQAEFDLLSDQVLQAQQRLKGSCPWVFTYDGEGLRFVTDFLWRSPLGLRINAQETAGIMTTEDWVKIDGDALVPRDGAYDVRITAELWETHFFDHVSLMAVDHPAGTDVFVDERFAFPPPPLTVYATDPLRPVAGAWDDLGTDVTDRVRARDERYLDTFGRGAYQGVTREHFVEVDLGPGTPADGPLWLVAQGWIRPTDSSINVALSHGALAPPRGLRLDVPDGQGGWTVARPDLGFPAGKAKSILIDLTGVFPPGAPRRLRLSTNLEVYWDALAWTTARPDADLRTHRLAPTTADLRYRGYSAVHEADRSSPELPDYQTLAGTAPRWRDLIGYHTRYGDVRPLLDAVDDRYVIMNAGDEMRFRFPALPPPPAGYVRDFVLIGDGWVKDGDYNTSFSKTVRPLPRHAQPTYTTPPGRLQDDPVYQRYPEDWQTYHTRYVTPDRFQRALRPR